VGSEVVDSIRCISPQKLQNIPACRVIVAVNGYQEEISNQCLKMNIPQNHIFCAPLSLFIWRANYDCTLDSDSCSQMVQGAKEILAFFGNDRRSKEIVSKIIFRRLIRDSEQIGNDGDQYFIPELPIRSHEIFVDGGAYDGDTLTEFVSRMPADARQIQYYAFECDPENYKVLQRKAQQVNNLFVETYPIGLWSEKGTLCFVGNKSSGVIMNEQAGDPVQVDRLDDILAGKSVTWIKMDIEGTEQNALIGCASIIQKYKPRLSICIYHRTSDLYEIPRYIKSLRDDYQMLLRHHSESDYETILYAY